MKEHRDFTLFKKTFRKYQVLFGLTGWDVAFEYTDIGNSSANITYDLSIYKAVTRLSTAKNRINIKDNAKHECLHLLLARLDAEASTRFTSEGCIVEANEEAVHRLMEVIP